MMIRWIGMGACATGLVLAGTLVGCLPTDGLLGAVADGSVVAGDTAQGASGRFAGGFGQNPMMQDLADEQRAQLESLRAQLQNGEITRDEFVTQAQEIVGDEFDFASREGRPPFGARHGFGGGQPPADLLDLTDDQRTAARDIFSEMRADLQALQDASREEGRALLTAEQQAILDDHIASHGEHPMGGPPFDDFADSPMAENLTDDQIAQLEALRTQVQNGEITHEEARELAQGIIGAEFGSSMGRGGPPFGGFGFGGPVMSGPHHGPGQFDEEHAAQFAELLGLTDDQQTEITAIREATRDAVEGRRAQARGEFRALLTDEQLATLDDLEANRPWQP